MAQTESDSTRLKLKPLSRLLPYISKYPKILLGALVALILASLATLTVPMAIRRVIDNGFSAENADTVDQYFLAIIGVVIVIAVASASRYFFVTMLGERVIADIRADVFKKVLYLDAKYIDGSRTGEIISRLTADTTQIKSAVGSTASIALRNVFLFFGAAIMMIYTSPGLSSLILFAIPAIVIPLVAVGRHLRKKSRVAQDKLAEATAYATEMVSSVREVQSFTAENFVGNRFQAAVENSFQAAKGSIFVRSILTTILIFIVFSSISGILWFGATAVIEGTMTPGTLGQFLLYAMFAAGSLGALSEVWGEVQQTAGATERLMELLAEESALVSTTSNSKQISPGDIEFNDVSFSYTAKPGSNVLENMSFHVKDGDTLALVGPSGGGKSTVFSLLMRFYDANRGSITIDGTTIKSVTPESLRSLFSIVPQVPIIFADTIAENIKFGADDASSDDILKAAKAANAHEFISKMPDGYDSRVGERGVTLSGGQRQRIAIARAILRNAPILLLDEATSALDAESEAVVQQAIGTLMEGRTTIVIAHRLATILNADQIMVVDKGQIVETGTHESLVEKDGIYARLAKLQFEIS